MFRGALIAESVRTGARLEGVQFTIRMLYRVAPPHVSPDQPATWTVIEFEVAEEQAEEFAKALTEVLDSPGWYCDFGSSSERYVVFPGRIFRYAPGDGQARAEAQAHGRSVGVPEAQLDWRD
jgi:hypothetical protein